MGLLDDLIGQLATGQLASNRASAPPQPTQAGGGLNMSAILIALAPIALQMLNSRSGAGQMGSAPATGGGLGDVLGQILGGGRGTSGTGGLGDLLEQFQRAGFGDQTRSWVGTGQNQPLPPNALEQVFGRDGVAEIARRAGLSEADASRGLSQLLPEMVDRVTPSGQLPDGASLVASVDDLTRRLRLG